jgi:ubiquinone/menaquinone biosynthesis C-methylase UbiE
VELYVAVDNPRGSKFYRRFGFESYGVMPRALRVQGADYGEKVPVTGGSMATGQIVTKHYAGDGGLGDRIYARLRSLGFEEGNPLSPKDTAAVDQFHVGGFEATEKLAELLSPSQGSYVLDVGSGLGGASRYLAAKYGCRVVGIDITEEYCGVASKLAKHMGLQDLVEYRVGDVRNLPFSDESFDVVWTQHVSMNIAEKPQLYAGIFRVLKAGGRFAAHDVFQGASGPILFPVPWARTAAISYLQTSDAMRKTIEDAGFSLMVWNDVTESALQFLDGMIARGRNGELPPLGLDLLLGPEFPEMVRNFRQNLNEGRGGVVQAVFDRMS